MLSICTFCSWVYIIFFFSHCGYIQVLIYNCKPNSRSSSPPSHFYWCLSSEQTLRCLILPAVQAAAVLWCTESIGTSAAIIIVCVWLINANHRHHHHHLLTKPSVWKFGSNRFGSVLFEWIYLRRLWVWERGVRGGPIENMEWRLVFFFLPTTNQTK